MPHDFSTETSGLSPLRRFKGMLQTIEKETRQGQRGPYDVAICDFVNVEVIESTEPYPFPVAQLQISHSPRTETRWAALANSIRRIFGDVEGATTACLVGKKQEWALLPAPTRRPVDPDNPGGDWETQDTDCWQVVTVEGAAEAAEDLAEYLLDLADGKTDTQFNQAALGDDRVTADSKAVGAITARKLLPALIEQKKLTRDAEGVYHKA